jgi:hypothetical protein
VTCKQFWLTLSNLRELGIERFGDTGMKRASRLA